jgi:hypothetical protein
MMGGRALALRAGANGPAEIRHGLAFDALASLACTTSNAQHSLPGMTA